MSSGEDLKIANVKVDKIQELINAEEANQYEHFKMLPGTWGTVVITIVKFVTCICCFCCCCKSCRQCAFWVWDMWTPKECTRHTGERCCIVNNYNADRVQYNEIPQTPPLTPGSSYSLPVSFQRFQQFQSREPPEPRRRSSRTSENLELTEFRRQPIGKERKGER